MNSAPTFASTAIYQANPRICKFDEFRVVNPHLRLLSNAEISKRIENETSRREKGETVSELLSCQDAVRIASGFSNFDETEARLRTQLFSSVLISHEGSSTGAPVVCANLCRSLPGKVILISFGENQAFMSLDENALLLNFANKDRRNAQWGFIIGSWVLQLGCLSEDSAVIGSTIESCTFLSGLCLALNKGGCTLLHEHAQYYEVSRLEELLASSQVIVYSSEYVKSSWVQALSHDCDGIIRTKNLVKIPQPIPNANYFALDKPTKPLKAVNPTTLRICGAGHVQPRKGVHLFLELCREIAILASADGNLSVEAIWVGMPQIDTEYSRYIQSKARSLSRNITNLSISLRTTSPRYYEEINKSDLFVCPSTVDPLPNIVYDSLCLGTPTFIFSSGNGHVEYFKEFGLDQFILDQNNLQKSAEVIFTCWVNREALQSDILLKYKKLLSSFPSHEDYAEQVLSLARYSTKLRADSLKYASKIIDFEKSAERLALNHFPFSSPSQVNNNALIVSHLLNLWGYKRLWLSASEAKHSYFRFFLRLANRDWSKHHGELRPHNLLIDLVFLFRQGSPSFISSNVAPDYDIHLHAYYPDVAITNCNFFCNLVHRPKNVIITYTKDDAREIIENNISEDLNWKFIKVSNIGRNLLPISSACPLLSSPYTVHLHTKKSLHSSADIVKKWTDFLVGTLFGDDKGSRLAENLQMMENHKIELAYPLDPNVQWIGRNESIMNEIVQRMQLNGLIDSASLTGLIKRSDQIPYPCGYMFIAETKFLEDVVSPVLSLIDPNEIQEPLPYDGTILHALERLTPLLATVLHRKIALLIPSPNMYR